MNVNSEFLSEFRIHPLGFYYKVKIIEESVYRLHVWLSDEHRMDQTVPIHTHSYDLRSTILFGGILNREWTMDEGADGKIIEFSVIYNEDQSKIEKTGKNGKLILESSNLYLANSVYAISAGQIHSACAIKYPTVTFVETYDRGFPVYAYGEQVRENRFERRSVHKEEAILIGDVLSLVPDEQLERLNLIFGGSLSGKVCY